MSCKIIPFENHNGENRFEVVGSKGNTFSKAGYDSGFKSRFTAYLYLSMYNKKRKNENKKRK